MMPGTSRGQPPKPVIAIPSVPVRKAGGKALEFPSVKACAAYFGYSDSRILSRILTNGTKRLPTYGYYFDYKM